MTDAPKRIWAMASTRGWYTAYASNEPGMAESESEYHLAHPGQPCSTDEFLERLQASEWNMHARNQAVAEWLSGDFTAAMEGL